MQDVRSLHAPSERLGVLGEAARLQGRAEGVAPASVLPARPAILPPHDRPPDHRPRRARHRPHAASHGRRDRRAERRHRRSHHRRHPAPRRPARGAHRVATSTSARRPTCRSGALDITLYRDDLQTVGPRPVVGPTDLPWDIDGKHVVIVDDVLYTGRTVRAALDELADFGRPRAHRARRARSTAADASCRSSADVVGKTVDDRRRRARRRAGRGARRHATPSIVAARGATA